MPQEQSLDNIAIKDMNGSGIKEVDAKSYREIAQKYLDAQKNSLSSEQYNLLHKEIVTFLGKVDKDFSQLSGHFESIKNKITTNKHSQITELKKEVDVIIFMDEALRLINDEAGLKIHLDILDGKIDQSSKDKLLSDIATQRDMLIQSDISYMRKDRNIVKLQKKIEALRLINSNVTTIKSSNGSIELPKIELPKIVLEPIPAIKSDKVQADSRETAVVTPRGTVENKNTDKYNRTFYNSQKKRFENVAGEIKKSTDNKVKELQNLIDAYLDDQNSDTAGKIQTILINDFNKSITSNNRVNSKTPDKMIGAKTLGALEEIVGIESPAIVAPVKRANGVRSKSESSDKGKNNKNKVPSVDKNSTEEVTISPENEYIKNSAELILGSVKNTNAELTKKIAELTKNEESYLNFISPENMLGLSTRLLDGNTVTGLKIQSMRDFAERSIASEKSLSKIITNLDKGTSFFDIQNDASLKTFFASPEGQYMLDMSKNLGIEVCYQKYILNTARLYKNLGLPIIAESYYDKLDGTILENQIKGERLSKIERFKQGGLTSFANDFLSLDQLAIMAAGGAVGKGLGVLVGKSEKLTKAAIITEKAIEGSKWAKVLPGVQIFKSSAGEHIALSIGKGAFNIGLDVTKFMAYSYVAEQIGGEDAGKAVRLALAIIPGAKAGFEAQMSANIAKDASSQTPKLADWIITKYGNKGAEDIIYNGLVEKAKAEAMKTGRLSTGLSATVLQELRTTAQQTVQGLESIKMSTINQITDDFGNIVSVKGAKKPVVDDFGNIVDDSAIGPSKNNHNTSSKPKNPSDNAAKAAAKKTKKAAEEESPTKVKPETHTQEDPVKSNSGDGSSSATIDEVLGYPIPSKFQRTKQGVSDVEYDDIISKNPQKHTNTPKKDLIKSNSGDKSFSPIMDEVFDVPNPTTSKFQRTKQDVSDVVFKDNNGVKYFGETDKFVIAKSNKSDIQTFQKSGYDLTPYGFKGWNIQQIKENGVPVYKLTHNDYGIHVVTSPKDVQTFLLTGKVETKIVTSPQNLKSGMDSVIVIDKSIKDVLNRTVFSNTKVSTDGLTRINLDGLGLEGVIAVKYKNPGKSLLQYKIEGLNPKDNNFYSLGDLQKRVEEIQRSRSIIQK